MEEKIRLCRNTDKKFQLWELFLNLLKASFPYAHKFIWKRDKRHCSFCQVLSPETCMFPLEEENIFAHMPVNKAQLIDWDRGGCRRCSALQEQKWKILLPSYTASFSRICFCQLTEASAMVYNVNTLGSWGHELRFPLELKEPHAVARGWQAAKPFFTWQNILTLFHECLKELIGNASDCWVGFQFTCNQSNQWMLWKQPLNQKHEL